MNTVSNSNSTVPDEIIRKKKFAILICGVILYFLTCMAKGLVPGIIYNDLLKAGLSSEMIAGTGAAFMYAYAASQLLAGVFSNRYGGVRILLTGGTLFAVGTILFPWCGIYSLMIAGRILTGLGAGTVFLGVVKILSDLFPAKFAMALGTVMLCSYFGPVCGTTPMVMLVELIKWQWAMTLPGAAAAAAVTAILVFAPGTIKPVVKGETFKALGQMLKNRKMWLLNLSASSIFGTYYIISTQIGQKSVIDHCSLTAPKASLVIMVLTIIVAVNNVLVNLILKCLGNRRKVAALLAFTLAFLGAAAGYFAFGFTHSVAMVTFSFVLIAIPAGFFPLFSTIAKEINPPEETGLAVALLNFWCFAFIALYQNISGRILQHYTQADTLAYPPQAYCGIFIFLMITGIAGIIAASFYPETRPQTNSGK